MSRVSISSFGSELYRERIPQYLIGDLITNRSWVFLLLTWFCRGLALIMVLAVIYDMLLDQGLLDLIQIVLFSLAAASILVGSELVFTGGLRSSTPISIYEGGLRILRSKTGFLRARSNYTEFSDISKVCVRRGEATQRIENGFGEIRWRSAPLSLHFRFENGCKCDTGLKDPYEVLKIIHYLQQKGIVVEDSGFGPGLWERVK